MAKQADNDARAKAAALTQAWAIKFVGSPLDGHRSHFRGIQAQPHTLLFETRREARAWIAKFKKKSGWTLAGQWAERGGARIYRSVTPVRVNISISET